MRDLSRRSIIAGAAVVPIAISLPAAAGTGTLELDNLWRDRLRVIAKLRALKADQDAAEATLPAWAALGPQDIDHAGKRVGVEVGWPEITDPQPASFAGAVRRVRPGPRDLAADFNRAAMFPGGEKHRAAARVHYRVRMRALVSRLREQRAEQAKRGIPALQAHINALYDQLAIADNLIEAAAPSPNAAAAILLAGYGDHAMVAETAADGCELSLICQTLRALRPLLTGVVAESCDMLLSSPDTPIADLSLWA